MLFWTRAFLCIGTVTVLAVGRLPAGPVRSDPPARDTSAATLVESACHARPDLCAAALAGGLGALSRPAGPATVKPRAFRRSSGRALPVALPPRSLT